jgi:hypothetical protein
MRRITGRFVLLIATAAVLPLVIYGLVSVQSLRKGTEQSVGAGNQAVAQQVAYRIELYFNNNIRVLSSIATQIRGTQLEPWQRERILRNHVLDFDEFREISVFDGRGDILATSRISASTLTIPSAATASPDEESAFYVDVPHIDADGLPTTTIAVSLAGDGQDPGWIVAELSLEELWRTVDSIKIGSQGYALLMDQQARLLAHGNPNDKGLIATNATASLREQELAAKLRRNPPATEPQQFYTVLQQPGGTPPRGGRGGPQSAMDRPGRTADRRGLRGHLRPRKAAVRRHRSGPPRHGHPWLGVGPILHPADLRTHPGDESDRRRPDGRACRPVRP